MTKVVVQETIAAPIEAVFAALTDPERAPEFDTDVVRVEYLSEQRGAGARFAQVRRGRKGEEQSFELEVREYEPTRRARMVTDSHGTIWDSVYTFEERAGATLVTIAMDAQGSSLVPKVMNTLMRGFFKKGIRGHLANAKKHLEAG